MNLKSLSGFSIIKILIWGIIIILVLSYFKINIRGVVESPEAQENIEYVKEGGKTIWEEYLQEPAKYIWNNIFIELLWNAFVENLERVRDGKPTEIEEAAPILPTSYTHYYHLV
ncbi:MAG: hypothetical protein WCX79_04500 [Candidatus Paceibacterota bacterium]|jgi:hypothetical protein